MTAVQVMIPEDISQKAREIAQQSHITLDELASRALIEKVSGMIKDPYLEARAKRADWKKFHAALALVPDVPPEDYDKME